MSRRNIEKTSRTNSKRSLYKSQKSYATLTSSFQTEERTLNFTGSTT